MSIFTTKISDIINSVYQSIYILNNIDNIDIDELSEDVNKNNINELSREKIIEHISDKKNDIIKPANNDIKPVKHNDSNKPIDINKPNKIDKLNSAKDIKVNDSNREIDKEVIKEINNQINKQNNKLINYQNNKNLDKNIINLGDKVVNEVGNRQKIISVEDGGNDDIIDFNLL